jgi:DNA-3-methyladenine glycosylase II
MQQALEQLRLDPVLAGIIQQVGPFTMGYRDPDFGSLVRSILSQQISSKVAKVFIDRLVSRMPDGRITPEAILRMRAPTFRKLGFSAAKTAYIRDLAHLTKDGELVFAHLPALNDDEIVARLTQVKGIGVWTAQMFLMFGLRRPDILPTGDLGIRVAMQRAYSLDELPKPAEMLLIAQNWRPWCSVACWYLWRSLDGAAQL